MTFVTYSGVEPSPDSSSSLREQILSQPLTPLEKKIFEVPLEQWRTVPREGLSGWRCGVPHPVGLERLSPVDPSDAVLRRISLHRGPVTALALDAVVNAANERCLGGGGVDGAVHAAAGPLLRRECATFSGCATGQCRVTKGYQLPARFVLHTVGPIGEKPAELQSCYRSVLSLAARNSLRTVGFCCISTGVYGYPLLQATRIALTETMRFIEENSGAIDLCCFACFQEEEYRIYSDCVRQIRSEMLK